MSDSVRPHRRKPTRLPHPWDSPGKNTGVGCHFLLQCMKVKSESEVTQSCPTLSDIMDCNLLGSSIHGIFQARVLEWGAIAFSTFTPYLDLIALIIINGRNRIKTLIGSYPHKIVIAINKTQFESTLQTSTNFQIAFLKYFEKFSFHYLSGKL